MNIRDTVDGVLVNLICNAAKAKLYGGELEVTAQPMPNFTLDGSLAYLHAAYENFQTHDTAGNPIDLTAEPFSAPKWTYNLGAAYVVPLSNGSIRFNANFAYTGTVNLALGQPGVALTVIIRPALRSAAMACSTGASRGGSRARSWRSPCSARTSRTSTTSFKRRTGNLPGST